MAQSTRPQSRPYFLGIQAVSPHSTKRSSTLPNALAHNRRSLQAAHGARSTIDPTRSHLNYTLAGMGAESTIITHWKGEKARLNARKNAPHAVEVLFTLPANWAGDMRAYFTECVDWACVEFGAANLLTADVHLDEAQPHCHALFLPIVNTPDRARAQAWLNPIGGRAALNQRCERFFTTVSAAHGLTQPPTMTLRHGERLHIAQAVIEALHQQHAPELKCPRWQVIKAAIECDPAPWCESLGVDITQVLAAAKPTVKAPDFVKIMTRPQRVEKPQYSHKPLARDFDEKVKPLSCVRDFQNSPVIHRQNTPELPPQNTAETDKNAAFNWAAKKVLELTARAWLSTDTVNARPIVIYHKAPTRDSYDPQDTFTEPTTREREDSMLANNWDYERGGFNPSPAKPSVKAEYERRVNLSLAPARQQRQNRLNAL